MIDFLLDFLNTPFPRSVTLAIRFIFWASIVYVAIQGIRSLSPAGRWKLFKISLMILFLPFVLIWKFTTAGSDCGCCCDEDD